MTNKLTPTELPDNHVDFAKDVAESAKKYGIEKFTLEYSPKFDIDNAGLAFSVTLKAYFSSKDERGYPADNLKISYETRLDHVV